MSENESHILIYQTDDNIIKGFALNDARFKSGQSMNYFNELQVRIRQSKSQEYSNA